MTDPTAPDILNGRYRLLDEIGRGGMGVVYRALDRLSGQQVALKRIALTANSGDTVRLDELDEKRILLAQEFTALARLRHPHIISVLDFGFSRNRQPYFAMELLEDARSLLHYARRQPLPAKIDLVLQMLQALVYLHRQGIIHRDLKPANVLVDAEGRVKVLDFGLADVTGTRSGGVGTIRYMSPEALRGGRLTPAADLYAVGVILYEMLTGLHPFDGQLPQDVIQKILGSHPDLTPLRDLYSLYLDSELIDSDAPTIHETTPTPDEIPTTDRDAAPTEVDGSTTSNEIPPVLEPTPHDLRWALEEGSGLQLIVGRLLLKDPEDRYQDAADVIRDLCEALERPVPAETAPIRESFLQRAAFVGRTEEFTRLSDALTALAAGQSGVWLIGGESGVGKSRLMDEVWTKALLTSALVLRGQGIAQGGAPYHLWSDPLSRLVLSTDPTDDEAGVLLPLIPNLPELLARPVTPAPSLTPGEAQTRLLTTIEALIRRMDSAVILLLEDLHWANESLVVARHLAGLASGDSLPLLIVGTYRSDEAPDLPAQIPGAQRIDLTRLTRPAVAELSRAMLGGAGQRSDLLDWLDRETEGNALFIVEVMRALADEAGSLDAITRRDLPAHVLTGGIRAIIRRRLDRIAPADTALLEIAVIAGRQLDLDLLRQIDPSAATEETLSRLAASAILEIADGSWRFTHDRIREVMLETLSPNARRKLHRTVAAALEALYADDRRRAAQIADHWLEADDFLKAATYVREAADQLRRGNNFREALAICRRLIDATTADDPVLLPVYQLAASSAIVLGDTVTAFRFHERLTQVAEAVGQPDVASRGYSGMGRAAAMRGDYAESRRYMERAVELSRTVADVTLIVGALNDLFVITQAMGDIEAARRTAEESLAIYRELGDPREIANGIVMLGVLASEEGKHEEGIASFREALVLYEHEDVQQGVAIVKYYIGVNLRSLKRYAESVASLREGADAYRKLSAHYDAADTHNEIAVGLLEMDDHTGTFANLIEALRLTEGLDAAPVLHKTLISLARLNLRLGQSHRAAELAGLLATRSHEFEPSVVETHRLLIDELRAAIPPDTLEPILQTGAALDFDQTISDIRAFRSDMLAL